METNYVLTIINERMEKDENVVSEILIAAKSLFGQFGLKKTTIEDISAAAGKGKSTLYYYFPGKNEIFVAVIKEEMKLVVRSLRHTVNAAVGAREKLKAFLTTQSKAILELRSLYKVLFEDIVECRQLLMPLRQKFEETQVEMITDIISGGAASGEFRSLSEEHIRKLALVVIIAFRGLQYPLTINPSAVRPEEYFDALVDMLIEGIGN